MNRNLCDLYLTLIPLDGFLFALGGWHWKWIRRWLMPLVGAYYGFIYGAPGWRCLAYLLSTAAVFSLGYSPDNTPWWQITLVGASYGLTPLWFMRGLRAHWWLFFLAPVVSAIWFVLLMSVSLTFNGFPWKLAEILIGSVHGALVAGMLEDWQDEPLAT